MKNTINTFIHLTGEDGIGENHLVLSEYNQETCNTVYASYSYVIEHYDVDNPPMTFNVYDFEYLDRVEFDTEDKALTYALELQL